MLFGLCFSQVEKDLYGKWMGVDQGEKGFVTFYPLFLEVILKEKLVR